MARSRAAWATAGDFVATAHCAHRHGQRHRSDHRVEVRQQAGIQCRPGLFRGFVAARRRGGDTRLDRRPRHLLGRRLLTAGQFFEDGRGVGAATEHPDQVRGPHGGPLMGALLRRLRRFLAARPRPVDHGRGAPGSSPERPARPAPRPPRPRWQSGRPGRGPAESSHTARPCRHSCGSGGRSDSSASRARRTVACESASASLASRCANVAADLRQVHFAGAGPAKFAVQRMREPGHEFTAGALDRDQVASARRFRDRRAPPDRTARRRPVVRTATRCRRRGPPLE